MVLFTVLSIESTVWVMSATGPLDVPTGRRPSVVVIGAARRSSSALDRASLPYLLVGYVSGRGGFIVFPFRVEEACANSVLEARNAFRPMEPTATRRRCEGRPFLRAVTVHDA